MYRNVDVQNTKSIEVKQKVKKKNIYAPFGNNTKEEKRTEKKRITLTHPKQ